MPDYQNDREVTYEIVEEIGILSSQPTGWTRELNVVSWNGGQPKYDIREWSPLHDRMSRGVTLNEQEMRMVIDLLKRRTRYVRRETSGGSGSYSRGASAAASGSGRNQSRTPATVADALADMADSGSAEEHAEGWNDDSERTQPALRFSSEDEAKQDAAPENASDFSSLDEDPVDFIGADESVEADEQAS